MKKKKTIVTRILIFLVMIMTLCGLSSCSKSQDADILKEFPHVADSSHSGYFPLATTEVATDIYIDGQDYRVVGITAAMVFPLSNRSCRKEVIP